MFYRIENNEIVGGFSVVFHKDYELDLVKDKDKKDLPDGWAYLNSLEEAYEFFGLEYLDVIIDDKEKVREYVTKLKLKIK